MEIKLLYTGPIKSGNHSKIEDKSRLRRTFSAQLEKAWKYHPTLSMESKGFGNDEEAYSHSLRKKLIQEYSKFDQFFLPVANRHHSLVCDLDIQILHKASEYSIYEKGDLDNTIKTLFDSLTMPQNAQSVGDVYRQSTEVDPIYVLLDDDRHISSLKVSSDQHYLDDEYNVRINARVYPSHLHVFNAHWL